MCIGLQHCVFLLHNTAFFRKKFSLPIFIKNATSQIYLDIYLSHERYITLCLGLGLPIATGYECININGTKKTGTIKFQPTPDYRMDTVNCKWKFSSPKQEPFLLVFLFQRLTNYDSDDSITLPDGK